MDGDISLAAGAGALPGGGGLTPALTEGGAPTHGGGDANPFAEIDAQMSSAAPGGTEEDNPFKAIFPAGVAPGESSAVGAFTAHAARGIVPMVGGMAGAGAGAEAGAAGGAAIGAFAGPPGAAVGGLVGGFAGGLLGFFGGSYAAGAGQDWALHQAPDSWQDALGQSSRAERLQEAQHPIASFIGGIAPYALTMSPGGLSKAVTNLPEDATTFQRIMANPLTGKLFSGAMMGGMELGQEKVEGEPTNWAKVAISTGFGLMFSQPNRFGEYLTGLGARPVAEMFGRAMPHEGVLNPEEPTVAQAADLGVAGPGITEATFHGTQQQSDETRTTAQNNAADEQAALGPLPVPDLDALARRIDPDTFARNDELLAQRDALRQFVQDQSAPPDEAFDALASKRAEVEAALGFANPRSPAARGYRAQLTDLDAQTAALTARREAWENGTAVDTPEVMLARQHLLDTEHALWDLGPTIAAARRRAADHVGEVEPEEAASVESTPAEAAPSPESTPAQPEAPAEKSPEAQRAFITADRTAQLMAAGLSRATAEASAAVEAAYYQTLAARFGGALGTAEDLYRARAARVAVPGAAVPPETPPQPITRTEPTRVRIRTIAEIQAQENVSATKARRIQEQEILAKGRVIEPGTPREEPAVARAPEVNLAEKPATAELPPENVANTEGSKLAAAELTPRNLPAEPAATPEFAEAAQITPPAPEPRPRLRSATEIMREDKVPEGRVKAIQDQELTALSEWQARNPATGPRPKRNRATATLAENVGIPAAGVPEPEVVAEIVDRLPAERVIEEVNAEAEAGAIEYQEAEKAAEEVAPEVAEAPDQFYDSDQSRPLEALESEHRPANETPAPEQRPGGGGEPEPAAAREEPLSERGGPSGAVGGPGERPAGEAGAGGDVEHAVAATGAGADYRPGPAVEPGPAGNVAAGEGATERGQATPAGPESTGVERRRDARGNPIFAKGERVVIPDGEPLAGRHGTVEEATGLVFQSLYGGQRSEPSYSYQVRTDSGVLTHVTAPVAETGERPEAVPDPVYHGHAVDPASLQRSISYDEKSVAGYVGREARARTPKMKAEWRREAAAKRAEITAKRAVLDVWSREHSEEAERILGVKPPGNEPAAEALKPAEQAAPAGNRAGMSVVETRHTKTGQPLWVVTGGPRVERAAYEQMLTEAKQNGGKWSSFRGHGAIPGWTFETREGAEGFLRGGEGAEAPATSEPAAEQAGWRDTGKKNDQGETLYESASGVRSIVRDGVRVTEPVQLRPTRAGVAVSFPEPASKPPEFQSVEERVAEAPAPTPAEVTEQAGGNSPPPPAPVKLTERQAQQWWQHELTGAGRDRVTRAAGLPAAVAKTAWWHLLPAHAERLLAARGAAEVETPEARTISDALAPAEGKGPLPVTSAPEARRYEYATHLTKPGEVEANRVTVNALNGLIPEREAVQRLGQLLRDGEIGEGFARINLNRLTDWNEGEWEAAKRRPRIYRRNPRGRSAETRQIRLPRTRREAEPPAGSRRRPTPPAAAAEFGANNKMVTRAEADDIRARLRAKAKLLRSGVDPQDLVDGARLAVHYIEGGVRNFADYAARMIEDIGAEWRPYLRGWYENIRHWPGLDTRGMSTQAEADAEMARWTSEPAPVEPEPLNQQEAEDLYAANARSPILQEIGQRIADGETPEEIAATTIGDSLSEPEIAALADQLEARGEIPEPTEPEEADDGIQGSVPVRDEGTGAEDVHGTEAVGEAGGAPSGEGVGGEPAAARTPGEQAEEQVGQLQPGGREGGGGDRPEPTDRVPDAGEGSKSGATGRFADRPDAGVEGSNFAIEPGDLAEGRGRGAKARDNLAAIQLAKRLIDEDRVATKAEQAVLVKYSGWGGLKGAFEDSRGEFGKGFEAVGRLLKDALTEEEYRTAAQSTQYAHYTAEHVVRSMWDAVRRMGFEGGLVFEPGMGTGHFLGMMPTDLAQKSQYQGIERDHLTAQIAKLLYPESGIREADYIKTAMPEGTFDLVIGNPPFSDTVISGDPKYAARKFMLHDYFFAKSLDSVRPGGLLAFITSAGTMNKLDSSAREYLAERADLVGGIRLPNTTFKRNAGTEVTTDILFFQRRPEGRVTIGEGEMPAWTETVQRTLPATKGGEQETNVSRYFSENPGNVLGNEAWGEMQAAGRYEVQQAPGTDLPTDLQAAVQMLPENIVTAPPTPEERAALDFASGQRKDGSFYLGDDGRLMQYRSGAGREVLRRGGGVKGGLTTAEREQVRHLIPMRDALRDVFAADLAEDGERGAGARTRLNEHYDRFVDKFGPVNKAEFSYRRPTINQQEEARLEAREEARYVGNHFDDGDFDPSDMLTAKAKVSAIAKARDAARQAAKAAGRKFNEGTFDPEEMEDRVFETRPNIKPFMSDPESYRLRSIENYDDATGTAKKKDIFYESILKREKEPEINSVNDGVLWSLNKLGRFDIDAIADKMGKDRSDIVSELGDNIFKVPGTRDTYQTKDEYLSGDIVSKLETARAESERDPEVRRNVAALEGAMPPPVAPQTITMMLGMPWIPAETVREFARDHLDMGEPRIFHSDTTGTWIVGRTGWENTAGNTRWGTTDRDGLFLLSDALNRTPPKIYRTERNEAGRAVQVFDKAATELALMKFQAIQDAFFDVEARTGWAVADTDRADALAKIYNDELNRSTLRQFDGSYLTTPGIASTWKWRPHQTRGIARIIQTGNTYLAHAVGSGKTSEGIGAIMEMRRLGLIRKGLIITPNHMLGQWTKEFYEQYPTARLAIADEQRFHTDVRRQFVANAAQDDLDAVIMTMSSFGKIPISDSFQAHLIREQIEMFDKALAEVGDSPDARFTRGRIENQKEKLEQKLSKQGQPGQDQVLNFEEFGADFLLVDEGHLFRKLSFASKQSGMKGISPEGSNMAWDLYTKVRYLDSQNPGRSLVMMSGTPVTNTMGELYSLSRYMQPEALKERGLSHFDSWAQSFGNTKTELEETPDGALKPVTRFRKFMNVPALYKMVGEVMDIVTPNELEQYVTRPQIAGGKRELHVAPRTEVVAGYQRELGARMKAIEERRGPPQKGDDILLSVINDGRHLAIDPRFVMDTKDDPRSKLNMMVKNVADIYRRTGDVQFYDPGSNYTKESMRGPATQMIFSNLGVNGRGPMDFSAYQWIKESLRREGIPADQIAFIGDYKTALQRQALFNDMNEGKVRVLVGSTQKMGTGVNAQKRLFALHNLDPLWYPADDEQRVGRILRQGNHNPLIEIHDYTTKGTYDKNMWDLMGKKAGFIEAFFRGDPNVQDIDDVGEASMYEQAAAMSTMDERFLTLAQMKQDLDKARRLRSGHDSEQYALRQKVINHQWWQDSAAKRATSIREDIARREDIAGDKFSMTVGGKKLDKRKDAEAALAEFTATRADELGKGADTPVGRIGGFPIVMVRSKEGGIDFELMLSGGLSHGLRFRWNGSDAEHAERVKKYSELSDAEKKEHYAPPETPGVAGLIASAEHMLRSFEEKAADADASRVAHEQAIANIRPLIGQPFTGGPEIDRLTRGVADLEQQIKNFPAREDGSIPEAAAQPTAAERPSWRPERTTGWMAGGGDLYQRLRQTVQGKIRIAPGEVRSVITLARAADASTFMHETAHDWLKQLMQDAGHTLAPAALKADAATVRAWLKRGEGWTGFKQDGSPDVAPQERFARGFEQYLREGHAPSPALAGVFAQFKSWLTTIYRTLRGLGAPITDDIRQVFDRMLALEPERTTHGEVPDRQPSLATIHEADAAETHPHEADAVADRVAAERARNQPPPEIAHEIAAAGPAEPAGTGPAPDNAAEVGPGATGRGPLAADGGQPEPEPEGGGVGAGPGKVGERGGQAAPEGAGVAGAAGEPAGAGGRRGAGGNARSPAEQLAPGPAESIDDTGATDAVDLAGNIRVENLTDVESIAQAIHDSADRNDEFKVVRGGMTKGQMLDLAEAMGLDPTKIDEAGLARLLGGTDELGAKILAARKLVVQSAEIVAGIMRRAAKTWTDADGAALGLAIARHDMIQSALAGVTAEWGRAGNAFHSLLEGWGKAQDLNQLLRDNTGRDLYQLRTIAKLGSRMDTPGKVSKLLRDAKERSFGGMLLEYWINGLISGFATHTTYVVGNAILAAVKAGPETAAAAMIGRARGRTGGRVHLGEVGAQFRGALRELPAAAQATVEAYRTGATTQLPGEAARPLMPFQGDTSLTVGRGMTNAPVTWREAAGDAYGLIQGMRDGIVAAGELVRAGGVEGAPTWGWQSSPLGQIPGLAYKGVEVAPLGHLARLPSRNVAAIHSAFRAMNYSMEINALAYRAAAEEGLTGTALASRVAALRQSPTEAMMDAARGKATDLTLMGQGGRLTQNLSAFFNKSYELPFFGETQVLKFVDPFVHIAGNIMNQSLMQRTPLGLLSREIRADLTGKNGNVAQDTAMAKMLVGTTMAVAFGGLAAQGLASGSGPADPNKAAMWRLAGNQAHSVRIGDIWYDVHRLGPMGMLLSVSADLYDVAHQIGTENADVVAKSLMHAFTQNILDESFMRGPADLIKAVTDPDRYGSGYIRTWTASLLPYSVGMAQMARAMDPYSRQARTLMDAVRAHVPGLSESLFPRRDIWGEPMPNGDALLAPGVTAIYMRQMSTDPVNLAMLQLGIGPASVERSIRNVPLTDQQYDDYARLAGRSAKMRLDVIVRSPDWQTWPNATRHEVIEETIRQSREASRGMMMMKYPQIVKDAAVAQMKRRTGQPAPAQ